MTLTGFQKLTLGLAGATATAAGAALLLVPRSFLASYGVALPDDPSLLSELRAPGAALLTLGGAMLAGLVWQGRAPLALLAAAIVYIAFPMGRMVGFAFDGRPSSGILAAFAAEVAIGCLLMVSWLRAKRPAPAPHKEAAQ